MKALIFNNKVVDVAEKSFEVHNSMVWMDAPDGCIVGWLLKGGELIAPEPDPEKTYAEERRKAYGRLQQFELQYDDEINGTTKWKDAIEEIKKKYPKPK